MGIELKFSHMLQDLGFFSALGTMERKDGEQIIVGLGTPFTTDHNMGVTVIYDEAGRPWIIRNTQVFEGKKETEVAMKLRDICRQFNLYKGAHVPHSNDGGDFVRMVLPNLLPKIAA